MKLVNKLTGNEVLVGHKIMLSTGNVVTVTSIQEPRHGGSTGRVYVKYPISKNEIGFYPSVVGAHWVDREDREQS